MNFGSDAVGEFFVGFYIKLYGYTIIN